jgi:DNA invertase Pin-like site-specific DNA recombinase
VLPTPGGSTGSEVRQLIRIVSQTLKRAVLCVRVSTEAQTTDDKTSLSEQLLALRKYADSHGYKVVEGMPEEVSGRKQDTEELERIRDLAKSGEIVAVLSTSGTD